jgi:uncharacterized protein YndB with AHSA1/START domain
MSTFRSTRDIPATPGQVFAAISDPERLARWWDRPDSRIRSTFASFGPAGGGSS